MKKTSKQSIQYCFIVLLITFCLDLSILVSGERKNGVSLTQTSSLLSSIKNGDSIVGVRTFLTLFVWKSRFTSSELSLISTLDNHDDTRNFMMNWLKNNKLTIGTLPDFTSNLWKFFTIYQLPLESGSSSSTNTTLNNIYLHVDMCQRRNYFRRYDGILLDPYMFSFYVRFYRDVEMIDNKLMESSDFIAFPLIPYEVYSSSTFSYESLFEYEQVSCSDGPDVADAQQFRWLTGYSNFSQTDLLIIQAITDTTQLSANYSHFQGYFSDLSFSAISSSLLPSTCYMCATSGCFGEDFKPILDYWIIPQACIVFTYFALFFILRIYKKPAMIRRIGLPYCSLLNLVLMITFTGLSRTCVGFWYSISLFVIFWWFFMYIATIGQFYFLRSLYSLIIRYPKQEKLLKMIASQKGGFLLTVVFTFFLSIVVNCISIFFFINEDKTIADIYRPVIILIILIIIWIIGLISVIYDITTQRKSILKDGLRRFFFYDDPFYLRVDLLTLLLPVVIAITTGLENLLIERSAGDIVETLDGIFNTLACLSFTLVSGGNVLIIEIYKMIVNRKKKTNESIEIELENPELLKIFKEYSEKEFSSENYELYMILKPLKERKVVKLKEMQDIESEFIKTYSKYEVNLPSSCKKEFYLLLKECEKNGQISFEQLWSCIGIDLILNLSDTFKRLQETSTYKKWESVQSYTKHINDFNP